MNTPAVQIPLPNASITELLRRVEITGKARYHSARRLSAHGGFSQWTLALLAVGQIVIGLITSIGLRTNFDTGVINFSSIFFGVLVLTYSLLLGMANFSARSVKMHGCGLELGRLARHLVYLKNTNSSIQSDYDNCAKEYYDILDKHENHTRTDYLTAHYEYYDDLTSRLAAFSQEWCLRRLTLLGVKTKLYLFHALQFSHYILSLSLVYIWIYFFIH